MPDLTLSSPKLDDGGGQRDRTTRHLFIDLTLSSPKFDDGGGHRNDGMNIEAKIHWADPFPSKPRRM